MHRLYNFSLQVIVALVVLTIAVPIVAAGESVVLKAWLGVGGVEGDARLVWLPCNGSLTPFYHIVYVVPPGYDVASVKPVVVWRQGVDLPVLPPAAIIERVYPKADTSFASHSYSCKAIEVQHGVWRGAEIVTVLVALYSSRGLAASVSAYIDIVRHPGEKSFLYPLDAKLLYSIATKPPISSLGSIKTPYNIGIIVVTRSMFLPVVEEWAEIKERQGYRVEIVTLEDLCKRMAAGIDLREQLRDYIRRLYEESNGVYRYLVIVGDASGNFWSSSITSCDVLSPWEVPTQYFYNPASADDVRTSHSGYFVPSDIYYVTFDGNWDADGDGILGEYPDDVAAYDPYPEMIVARIPVRSLAEARQALLAMEDVYPTTNSILLAGSILYYRGEEPYPELAAQGDTMLEGLYSSTLEPLGWIRAERLYEHYPVEKVIVSPVDLNGNLTHDTMRLALQSETRMVTIFAHGSKSCVWRKVWVSDTNGNGEPDPDEITFKPFLCAEDAPLVKPQLLYATAACLTAYFDDPTLLSLGEALAVQGSQYVGWSRITFGPLLPPDAQMDPNKWCCSDRLVYYLYLHLVARDSVSRIGDALLHALVEYVSTEPLDAQGFDGNVSRRVFFALMYMGDPTRLAYSTPTLFNPSLSIIPTTPYSTVNVVLKLLTKRGEVVENAPVTVYKLLEPPYGISLPLGQKYTLQDGTVTFSLNVGVEPESYIVYYPGSTVPPNPLEPTAAIITLNTSLAPWVVATPSTLAPGQWVTIVACNFPRLSQLEVYAEGVLVTKVYTNSSGCAAQRIALPYTLPPGRIALTVVYPRDSSIRASTSIVIVSNLLMDMHDKLERIEARLATVTDYLRSLHEKLQAIYESLTALQDELSKLEQANRVVLNELNITATTLIHELDMLALHVNTVKELVVSMASDVKESKTVLYKVVENLDGLSEKMAKIREKAVKLEELLNNHSSRLAEYIEETRSQLLQAISEARNALGEAIQQLDSLTRDLATNISRIDARLGSVDAKLARLEENITAIHGKIVELQGRIASVSSRLGKVNVVLTTLLGNMTRHLLRLENELDKSTSDIMSAVMELKSIVDGRLRVINVTLDDIKSRVSNVEQVSHRLTALVVAGLVAAGIAAGAALLRRGGS
ncbi:C25 family cysteine peptidase [Pyrolobus fumarii]|nr:C25 family cysteine peptidase [Pyrolobus fumarii]